MNAHSNHQGRKYPGLKNIQWSWSGTREMPAVRGDVTDYGGLTHPFDLRPEAPDCGFWLTDGDNNYALHVLLVADNEHWLLELKTFSGVPHYINLRALQWQMDAANVPSAGKLELPTPWKGEWRLQGQDSSGLIMDIRAPGIQVPQIKLSIGAPSWRTNLVAPLSRWECSFDMDIASDNSCSCWVRLPSLPSEYHTERLERWPGRFPTPDPAPDLPFKPDHHQPAIESIEAFKQLGFLTLQIPDDAGSTSIDALLQTFPLPDSSSYYNKLVLTKKDGLKNMQGLAANFYKGELPWEGQYVDLLKKMPGRFSRLSDNASRVVLNAKMADFPELVSALDKLFDAPPTTVLADPEYLEQQQRLTDSYLTLLVLDNTNTDVIKQFTECLKVLWLIDTVCHRPETLSDSTRIKLAQRARPVLPKMLFPLPADTGASPAPALLLSVGHLYEFSERVRGYQLGPVAEAINLLAGERQGHRLNHKTSTVDREFAHHTEQQHLEQLSNAQQRSVLQPQLVKRTVYDNLAETYATDGLSVTVSGNYLIEPGTLSGSDFQPAKEARHEAQQVVTQALGRMRRSVQNQREVLHKAALEDSQWQRLENSSDHPRRTFFHWLLEKREARLVDCGSRLLLNWTLDAPAQLLLDNLNAFYGTRLTLPIAPWDTTEGAKGVDCAKDLDQNNYLALAERYELSPLLAAPLQTINVTQNASLTLSSQEGTLNIPAGYLGRELTYAASPGTNGLLMIAGQANDLATPCTLTLEGLGGAVPFSLVGGTEGQTVSLRLTCVERRYDVRLADWQTRAYAQLEEGYRASKAHCTALLQRYCEEHKGGLTECIVSVLPGKLLSYVQSHYPQDQPLPVRRALQLEPWLRKALPWQQAVLTLVHAPQHTDFYTSSIENRARSPFDGLLTATQARICLPVVDSCAKRLIYILQSGGRLWLGEEEDIPLSDADLALLELWERLRNRDLTQDQTWPFNVDTCHRYASEQLELLPPCSPD